MNVTRSRPAEELVIPVVALRCYVTAGVAVIGAGLIAATPVPAPHTERHTVALAVAESIDLVSTLGQYIFGVQQILAAAIDPDLVGAPGQAADTTALGYLGSYGFTYAMGSLVAQDENVGACFFPPVDYSAGAYDASVAADAASTAHTGAANAAAALSGADAIQVFQADLSQLASANPASALPDLITLLNAAPAAAREALALAIDPAAASQVTAAEDVTLAAEQLATAQTENETIITALGGVNGSGTIDATAAANALSAAQAAQAQASQDVTAATDALKALQAAPPATLAELTATLNSTVSVELAAFGANATAALTTIAAEIAALLP